MNIGFLVNDLGQSQLIHELLEHISVGKENYTIFFKNLFPGSESPKCLTMNITGLSTFTGTLVTFDLESAIAAINGNGNYEIVLYLYDLEWLHRPIAYKVVRGIMKDIKLIARSEEHKKSIQLFTNNGVVVANNMKELEQWIVN